MTDSAATPAKPARRKADHGTKADHAMPAVVARTLGGLSVETLTAFFARETARFTAQRMETRRALRSDADHYMGGVPMHWMRDWPLPYPLVIARAEEARLCDLDGFLIDDFSLGDGAALYGHTPPAVVKAIRKQAERGISFMLPTQKALDAGAALSDMFGAFRWQIALSASDANRNAIKVARAVTRRAKVLVFDGAYHGTVDDLMVRQERGRTKGRRGLVGQVHDLRAGAVCVPFNDLAAVEEALATGEIAAILTEPVMTNCAMILPEDGFLQGLRDLATRHDAVLILDETHTQAAARGGYARAAGVTADIMVVGKAVAGGMPTAVWGVSDEIDGRFAAYDALRAKGHTGMGTTLAGNAMQAAALVATLTETATPKAFAKMDRGAARLAEGLQNVITRYGLPWHVVRTGARVEFICAPTPLRNGAEARSAAMPAIERALHIGLLNRGALISPFHNAMLVSPVTSKSQIARLVTAFEDVIAILAGGETAAVLPSDAGSDRAEVEAEAPRAIVTDAPVVAEAVVDTPAEAAAAEKPVVVAETVKAEVARAADAAPAATRRGWWSRDAAPLAQPAPVKPAAVKPAPVKAEAKPVAEAVTKAAPAKPAAQPVAQPAAAKPARRGWWQKAEVAAVTQDQPEVVEKAAKLAEPAPKAVKPAKAEASSKADAPAKLAKADKVAKPAKAVPAEKPAKAVKAETVEANPAAKAAKSEAKPAKAEKPAAVEAKPAAKAAKPEAKPVKQAAKPAAEAPAEPATDAKPARRGWWQKG